MLCEASTLYRLPKLSSKQLYEVGILLVLSLHPRTLRPAEIKKCVQEHICKQLGSSDDPRSSRFESYNKLIVQNLLRKCSVSRPLPKLNHSSSSYIWGWLYHLNYLKNYLLWNNFRFKKRGAKIVWRMTIYPPPSSPNVYLLYHLSEIMKKKCN